MLAVLFLSAALLPQVVFDHANLQPTDNGWQAFSQRPEIMPRAWRDTTVTHSAGMSLALSGNGNAAAYGGWRRKVLDVAPGNWYRLTAWYQTSAVSR